MYLHDQRAPLINLSWLKQNALQSKYKALGEGDAGQWVGE